MVMVVVVGAPDYVTRRGLFSAVGYVVGISGTLENRSVTNAVVNTL